MKHKLIRVSDLRESYRELGDKLFALYGGGRVNLKTSTHRVVVESSPTAILDVVLQGTGIGTPRDVKNLTETELLVTLLDIHRAVPLSSEELAEGIFAITLVCGVRHLSTEPVRKAWVSISGEGGIYADVPPILNTYVIWEALGDLSWQELSCVAAKLRKACNDLGAGLHTIVALTMISDEEKSEFYLDQAKLYFELLYAMVHK